MRTATLFMTILNMLFKYCYFYFTFFIFLFEFDSIFFFINLSLGKLYVRYLEPIGFQEGKDRDGMLRLVRRRMLGMLFRKFLL